MTILLSLLSLPTHASERPSNLGEGINPGTLEVLQIGGEKPDKKLEMPLQHTDVKIEVSGFVASTTVTQRYHNPFKKPIEAVYTFPLPNDAAVDDMQMTIGQRTIKGLIKRKKEAREIYERARERGQRASLLEQERPNIFTQSVANIMPGDNIVITIRYVNILRYTEGNYELVFPMVVGPRYIPGNTATGHSGTGWAPDTDVVPDASRITPPVLKPGERTGHDISLSVKLDAGVPIQHIQSISHVIGIQHINPHEKTINIHRADTLPNKDFVLRYQVAGKAPEMATIAHHDERGGFFTLIIQPQKTVTDAQVIPRELIFIVDTSGSMSGFPIEKSKEAMRRLIKGMRSTDTFNVIRFAGDTGTLWNKPQPHTQTNVDKALHYVEGFRGMGGTEMRKGIIEALAQPAAKGYLRIAFLLTDGYIGDEFRLFQSIEKERRGARVFSLGVGSSVNRYLLDRVAEIGRGEAFYVRQDENSQKVIDKFFQRVDRPALAHIEIDWGNLDVTELSPAKVPDLWAGQPIRIHGRYTQGGEENIVVRGQLANQPYQQKLRVKLPKNEPDHEAMATVWAREKVHQLMNQMVRNGKTKELIEKVTQLGLTFRLMTQWTSFVAVEEKVVNVDGKPKTIVQPVEIPEGVSYEGVFGEQPMAMRSRGFAAKGLNLQSAPAQRSISRGAPMKIAPSMDYSVTSMEESLQEESDELLVESVASMEKSFQEGDIGLLALDDDDLELDDELKLDLDDLDDEAAGMAPPPAPSTTSSSQEREESKETKKKVLGTMQTITFEPGKANLTDQAKRLLKKLAAQICQEIAQIKAIMITGHTDDSQVDDFKEKLSLERATVVADYLIKHCPALTDDKLVIKGQAARQPVASNNTETGRTANRRVEILIKN
jgi:Ca-activated chloride channel family protein